MKQNQNFDHNHSQKVLSCRYNMDTNRVEARFEDGTTLAIDCIAIEDEYTASTTGGSGDGVACCAFSFERHISENLCKKIPIS